jgi:hypothetical protein
MKTFLYRTIRALSFLFVLDTSTVVLAQTADNFDIELAKAEEEYYSGRFGNAIGLARSYLDKREPLTAKKDQAYKIIAQAYLAQDSLDQAKKTIQTLLMIIPDFEPNSIQDPPSFANLVKEIKQELQKLPVQLHPSFMSLRSEEIVLTATEAQAMLVKKGFYETRWNKNSAGFKNDYEPLMIGGVQVVMDSTTGLMWQKGGSSEQIFLNGATEYILNLNVRKFGGFSDWRLPTLEEAMSLVEAQSSINNLYNAVLFDQTQTVIWTADKASDSKVWVVEFGQGRCYNVHIDDRCYVRAVRSAIDPISITEENVRAMLLLRDFYDSKLNATGKGIVNQYELKMINGVRVILDRATSLMWQQSGSSYKNFDEARKYVDKLNEQKFAGFSNWRLPTLGEAMTLMESRRLNENLYIDEVFDKKQTTIWTADTIANADQVWGVSFLPGGCFRIPIDYYTVCVRAVRSVR